MSVMLMSHDHSMLVTMTTHDAVKPVI